MNQLSLLKFQRLREPGSADVASLADAIVKELGLEPPIDHNFVTSYLDVSGIEETELEVAGCLICNGQDVTIHVNASDSMSRQRFTIFHECTHTFFRGFKQEPQYRCTPSAMPGRDGDLEALCDHGASSLLLPQRYLGDHLLEANFGIATLMDVAETYEASLEATGHRIVDLAPYPTLFIVLEVGQKPSERYNAHAEPKLRVRAARGSGDWPFVPKHKSVSMGSPLWRALQGEVVHERTTLDEPSSVPVPNVEVSARLVPHHERMRVLALVRRNP